MSIEKVTNALDNLNTKHIFNIPLWHYKFVAIIGIGWIINAMETFIFVYMFPLIQKDMYMPVYAESILSSIVFAGQFIGSFIMGYMADKYGRKPVILVSITSQIIIFGLCGLSYNLLMLTIFRFICGIALGGHLPVSSTLVQELSPSYSRGKVIVFAESFWSIGCIVAVSITKFIAPEIGWRFTCLLVLIALLYAIFFYYWVPESPKWLMTKNKTDTAIEIVTRIQQATEKNKHKRNLVHLNPMANSFSTTSHNKALITPIQEENQCTVNTENSTYRKQLFALFRPPLLRRTIVLWIAWFSMTFCEAVYIYFPQIIESKGIDFDNSINDMLIIVCFQLPGYITASILVEILGRKYTLFMFYLGSAIAAAVFGYVPAKRSYIMVAGSAYSFFDLGAWGALCAYTPENYPTFIRATGASSAAGFSFISAILGPLLVPYMQRTWNFSPTTVMWIFSTVFLFAGIVLFLFGYEPKGKNIDDEKEWNYMKTTEVEEKTITAC